MNALDPYVNTYTKCIKVSGVTTERLLVGSALIHISINKIVIVI